MKNKKIYLIIIALIIIILSSIGIISLISKNKNKEKKSIAYYSEYYVAYVKINPSVKLDYVRNCTKYINGETKCQEPIVTEYELVNEDAKAMFKDIDLLKGNKNLYSVINSICMIVEENGIDVKNVNIESDWSNLNNYLEEEKNNITIDKENKKDTHNYTINIEEKNNIDTKINNDIKEEIEERAAKALKAKEEAQKKEATTIYLKNNVTYCHSMQTFECSGCFSTSLIDSLKKAKGHYVINADSNTITIKTITSLSGIYNNKNYFGNSQISKITAAGGEEIGGAGGCEEPVTTTICAEFNLLCE